MALVASRSSERGFSIVEVVIATLLMGVLAIGVAQLFAVGAVANLRAKNQTSLTMLGVQKMEQLKSLQWGYDQGAGAVGLPVSDIATDLSDCHWTSEQEVCAAAGGGAGAGMVGLNPSPDGALGANMGGYVEYLDRDGNWAGNGADIPTGAHYVRRWSIDPLPTNPNNTLVLQVRVLTRDAAIAVANGGTAGLNEVRLVSVKTRKSQ
jgi:hypothetical protein